MKKLLIIACLLTFVSCETETVTLTKDEYNKLKGVKKSEYPKPYRIYGDRHDFNWVIRLGEDGHEYLENNSGNAYVLIHFPSCKKCYHFDN
jgi:hypothetical protein